jgi:hypothetical protein
MVIKSEESATAINDYLKIAYGASMVDPFDKTSWKYYKNICGQYHVTDKVISITSLDTLEKITFSTDNLKIHRATSKAYQFGTRQYIELLALYPDQEQLILGILYPADMAYAISSADGTILSYPKYLVESNELTFIEKLNRDIEVYKIRWHNPQFGITDSLYSAAHLGLLYLYLVPLIINTRLAACKTNEAHSYHIRQYLASHGMLDVYLDTLTLKQTLFLYRNIAYIERNSGKREIFDWLAQHIMTERNLPLSEFTMKHNEINMLDNLYPTISFRKKLINSNTTQTLEGSYTLSQVFDKENHTDPGNKDYREEHESNVLMQFNNSLSSVLKTKLLESSIVDYTDATPYTMQSILLNEWLDLSSRRIYNVYVSFTDPRVGNKLTLIAQDAYIYMMYAFARSIGSNIDRIPSFVALHAQRIPAPDVDELMSVVDTSYIDKSIAYKIIYGQPEIPPDRPIVSVDAFYNLSSEIYNTCQDQIILMGNQEHFYRRGLVYNMIMRMYHDSQIHFDAEGELYANWLINKEMPTTDFTQSEYLALYKSIYEAATGSNLSTTATVSNLQKSMLNIFKQLSSYSIQFVSEINDSNIKVLNWGVIRLGDRKYQQLSEIHFENNTDVLTVQGFTNVTQKYNLSSPEILYTEKTKQTSSFDIQIKAKSNISNFYHYVETRLVPISSLTITAKKDGMDSIGEFIGYDVYTSLSTTNKKTLKSIYQ